jgi:DNA-binding XRE family transcriptional regulator
MSIGKRNLFYVFLTILFDKVSLMTYYIRYTNYKGFAKMKQKSAGERLRSYLKDNGIKQEEARVMLGLKSAHLLKIMRGRNQPRLELAFKIEALTKGEIKAIDFLSAGQAAA